MDTSSAENKPVSTVLPGAKKFINCFSQRVFQCGNIHQQVMMKKVKVFLIPVTLQIQWQHQKKNTSGGY